ncbi:MAG: RsmE family RNA methyltransferase [Christensenellales bacterium]
MDLKRFFSDTIDWDNKTATLTGEEYYHAVKVTRHKKGYKLILCGGDRYDYFCEVTEVTKDALYAKIESRSENNAESDCFITLFIGVNKELDTVVQKAVEMGVKKIVPFTSAHSNVDKINIDRLKKIVVESSKQCGRNYLAEVSNLVTLNEAFELSQNSTVFFYYEYEKKLKTKDVKNENG